MFRETWIGVIISPHGKPHQPKRADVTAAVIFAFRPQPTQQTSGELFQLVRMSTDQTECDVWTSTAAARRHFGQGP